MLLKEDGSKRKCRGAAAALIGAGRKDRLPRETPTRPFHIACRMPKWMTGAVAGAARRNGG
jgi:hypothetical protein